MANHSWYRMPPGRRILYTDNLENFSSYCSYVYIFDTVLGINWSMSKILLSLKLDDRRTNLLTLKLAHHKL